ncbi:MAG: hypothetical protein ACRDLQ_01515, partial [Solirubrobacterales bacterium]
MGFAPAAALGQTFGSLVTPTGPEEVVFDGPGTCPTPPGADFGHTVDGRVRAFRDGQQRVQMTLPQGAANRRLIGPSLDDLSPDCQVVHPLEPEGRTTPPSSYTNMDWITAVYRQANGTVYALLHNEYHGYFTNPPDCSPDKGFADCWMSSITSAVSTDDGETYAHVPAPPGHLVAALPYPYERDWGARGYQSPTNILLNPADGHFYAVINVRSQPTSPGGRFRDQEIGQCVIRTPSLDLPSWRAWNGTSFATEFINPYAPGYDPVADPPNHVCKPVSTSSGKLSKTFTAHSLTFSTFFNKFLMIGQQTRNGVRGFWYSLSDDLLDWSAPRLVRTNVPQGDCTTAERSTAYPSILDPADTTTNFDHPGRNVYLYFVRFNWCGSPATGDRDLARIPVRLERPLRWATGAAEKCPGGFDAHVTSGSGAFGLDPARNYSGAPASHRSDTDAGGGSAYGVFEREDYPADCAESDPTVRPTFRYSAGNDVWYSAAFLLPGDGFWNRPRGDVTLMRLDNRPARDDAAGILSVGTDNRLHFTTDPSDAPGDEVEVLKSGSTNGVPLSQDDCWHFVEVHQRIGDAGAVNELWLDGTMQDTVSGADNFHGAPYDRLGAGIVSTGGGGSGPLTVFTDLVGYGYGGPLSHIRCNGLASGAPAVLS